MTEICATCRYWDGPPSGLPNRWGDCRKRAPVLTPFTGTGQWPQVKYDSWCGEFEHRSLMKAIESQEGEAA